MNNQLLPPMLEGQALLDALQILPKYDSAIRTHSKAERLIALNDLYNIYLPNEMSLEIYSKIYLATLRSLSKKVTRLATMQRNENGKYLTLQQKQSIDFQGIIGGADCFTIIGASGIGKSSAISRSIQLVSNGMIELENPYCKVMPCLVVQCPYDCSLRGMLLAILKQTDEILDNTHFEKAVKQRATVDTLIGIVSQLALNHIGLLVVDEIQNVVANRNGRQLVAMLTQLINNSGISICMVGTSECLPFFESVDYLARRSLGLQYGTLPFDSYFENFCKCVFEHQYTQKESHLTEDVLQFLYENSGGVLANVITMLHDAQEIAILNNVEELNLATLKMASDNRMAMLKPHIKKTRLKQTTTATPAASAKKTVPCQSLTQPLDETWSISGTAFYAKNNNADMVSLLKKKVSVIELPLKGVSV